MSITINARGTSVSTFSVGKAGLKLHSNGAIEPPAGGNVTIDGHTWPSQDGAAGQTLVTDGAGALSWVSPTKSIESLSSLLIYYGYPIAYKGIWDRQAVINEISSNFTHWVVGHTYQDPGHESYADTVAVLQGVRANGVKVYGYIPLGTSSYNYTISQIGALVDQWITVGVDGIFIDEFGFDYGNTRQRQIDAVTQVRNRNTALCVNAWVFEEFACDSITETSWATNDWRYVRWQQNNPDNLPLPRVPGDSYLIENFCFDNTGPSSIWDTQERCLQVQTVSAQKNIVPWAVSVFAETTPGVLDSTKLGSFSDLNGAGAYISANAYLYGINVVGSGGFSFGSNGTPIWAPLYQMPSSATSPVANVSNNYTIKVFERYFGPVKLTVTNTNDAVVTPGAQSVVIVDSGNRQLVGTYPAVSYGTETQLTSKSTGVTLHAPRGKITMNNASMATNTVVTFVLTNSSITASSIVLVGIDATSVSGIATEKYQVTSSTMAGGCYITVKNISNETLGEALQINFVVNTPTA